MSLLLVTFIIGESSQIQKGRDRLALLGSFDFEDGKSEGLSPNHPTHWRVTKEGEAMVYELIESGEQGKVRAPTSWSLLSGHDVTSFVFTGRLKSKADPANIYRSLCIFFHFQDPLHFYYVHFGAISDEVHNIIALVNGADRIKINDELPGESVCRLGDDEWHVFKVVYDSETGIIEAYLDDMENPILTARDTSLDHGLVGVGSFDDTGFFDDLELWGILSLEPSWQMLLGALGRHLGRLP